MITILVLMLQKNVTKTTAMTTPNLPQNVFDYPPNQKVEDEPHIHQQVMNWSSKNGIYLLLILLLAWIITQIFLYIYLKICRHIRLDDQSHLAMEIHHERKSVTIILQSFNGRPDNYALVMPHHKPILQVDDLCAPTLHVNWYGATVIDDELTQRYPFPPINQITIYLIINQNYHIPYAPSPSSTAAEAPGRQPRHPRPPTTLADETVMTPDQGRQPRQPRPKPRTTLVTTVAQSDSSLIAN